MWLRGLVATASLVVIAAGGLWLWQQLQPSPVTREACLAALEAWVSEERTGDFDGFLSTCRDAGLIELKDVGQFAG